MGCKGAACSSAEGKSKGTLLPMSTCSKGQLGANERLHKGQLVANERLHKGQLVANEHLQQRAACLAPKGQTAYTCTGFVMLTSALTTGTTHQLNAAVTNQV